MKIIDEKGRLFGKVNIIDLSVILLILVVIPTVYLFYRQVKKPLPAQVLPKEYIIFDMDSNIKVPSAQGTALIKVGDKEIGPDGEPIIEILSLGEPANFIYEFDIGKGSSVTIADPALITLPALLRLKAEIRGGQLYFKDQRIYKDADFELITDKYKVKFRENLNILPEKKWIGITVKFPSLSPELSNIIKAGDEERLQNKDTIARITSIISNEPSKVAFIKFDSGDKFVMVENPYTYDVEAGMQLFTIVNKDTLFFKNSPVKIGAGITFSSNNYIINGVITSVQDE